jgi:hypothetical protein
MVVGGGGGGMYSQVNTTRIMDETERERGQKMRKREETQLQERREPSSKIIPT